MRRGSDLTDPDPTESDLPTEASPADAADQRRDLVDAPGDRLPDDEVPIEADPADVAEQHVVVDIDDDEAAAPADGPQEL
jgi:hypothetical protein